MELNSKFDFKSLRKAQNKIVQKYNRAGKALKKIGLSEAEEKQIQEILQPKFDSELETLMKEGAPAEEAKVGETAAAGTGEAATAAAAGGFV